MRTSFLLYKTVENKQSQRQTGKVNERRFRNVFLYQLVEVHKDKYTCKYNMPQQKCETVFDIEARNSC